MNCVLYIMEFTRRLPVYLLIDTSGSMAGEPATAVEQGIKALIAELKSDPQALETAYLSVITFSSKAVQQQPLTELMMFDEPSIEAGGATSLGAALNLLIECINREVRNSTAKHKGDWKPLVFILTDGIPTDILVFTQAVKDIKNAKIANIVACAAGSGADVMYLKQITDNVLLMNNLTAGDLAQFFAWVSSSVKMTSRSVELAPAKEDILPPLPQGFIIVE
ncbi:MAG: VWA domain-containing protein [Ruminococcus sp.]|nr:VWA domain-containing protein [Ruminococcus sp.]